MGENFPTLYRIWPEVNYPSLVQTLKRRQNPSTKPRNTTAALQNADPWKFGLCAGKSRCPQPGRDFSNLFRFQGLPNLSSNGGPGPLLPPKPGRFG